MIPSTPLSLLAALVFAGGIAMPALSQQPARSNKRIATTATESSHIKLSSQPGNAKQETRYLAFQIFTGTPNPIYALNADGFKPLGGLPDRVALRDYILDIKRRIGIVGDKKTRLAVILGPLSFDHSDVESTKFIEMAFGLALATDVAVGFHIDDSEFWARRKDLWSDPKNVEAMDWDGTPSTGRRLDWGPKPSEAPPQMCFNSKTIQVEVQRRSTLLGKAIQAGVNRLQQQQRPELFAGVIAGWETMIGQDFQTGKYLGYRALLNRGFSREHPPKDLDAERVQVVHEFIERWTAGLAAGGVSPEKIYSHTAFLPHRQFDANSLPGMSYPQRNHFAPPSVAFGSNHRPGFSTYPQSGQFDAIYEELSAHKQVGWASSEGTNLEPGTRPGQSGINMETYLAKSFNHGATLVNVFSWGIGGPSNRNNDFRQVTEGEEALQAYRKFLKGMPLVEVKAETLTLMERLPLKLHKIQKELPDWIQRGGDTVRATSLMKQLDGQLKSQSFEEAEKTADAILNLIGGGTNIAMPGISEEVLREVRHDFGNSFLVYRDKIQDELKLTPDQKAKLEQHLRGQLPEIVPFFEKLHRLKPEEQEAQITAYRATPLSKLESVLKVVLTADQRNRLRQLEHQREGLFGGGAILEELQITPQQRSQFMTKIDTMQRQMAPLFMEARNGGNPQEIRTKILAMRKELESQLEALLTTAQQTKWKSMIGKPIDVSALFDM